MPGRKSGDVITLTRLNGQPVMLNCDLIESVESDADTVVPRRREAVVVREPLAEIERKVVEFKQRVYGRQGPQ